MNRSAISAVTVHAHTTETFEIAPGVRVTVWNSSGKTAELNVRMPLPAIERGRSYKVAVPVDESHTEYVPVTVVGERSSPVTGMWSVQWPSGAKSFVAEHRLEEL